MLQEYYDTLRNLSFALYPEQATMDSRSTPALIYAINDHTTGPLSTASGRWDVMSLEQA